MGATPKYTLRWPELSDQADAPAAFQNLASDTEAAISTGLTSKLVKQDHRVDISGFTVGTSMLTYWQPDWVTLPSAASVVLIDVCLTVVSPSSTIGHTVVAFDNVYLIDEVWNTNGAGSRTMTYSAMVANKTAGGHSLCFVGVYVQAGGNVTVPHVSYAYRALA